MDNFKIIYKILKILERSMDVEEFDNNLISPESLNISGPRWCRIMSMLVDEGYITGVSAWNSQDCPYVKVSLVRPCITLKGLEYLQENTIMKKVSNAAKGIVDIIPGI